MRILVLNAGSATLKFGFYELPDDAGASRAGNEQLLARGIAELRDSADACIRFDAPRGRAGLKIGKCTASKAAEQVVKLAAAGRLADEPNVSVQAIGCRVVHGGARFTSPTQVAPPVLAEIRSLASLAPLHNPIDADVIEAAVAGLPGVPAVAVFDTAFHHTLPAVASTYALPHDLCETHALRRYGFHGISHRYVSERLLDRLGRAPEGTKLITCHLGNGSSVCAVRDGRSVDTSMGLTPLEGLVMGTRCGDVDPGLLLYLLRSGGFTAEALDELLNKRSGLAGISAGSGDVRDLEKAARAGDVLAELALEVFAYRACKYIGAYAAAMEGLDAVAFAGGIGEHSSGIRDRICRRLAFLGLRLDPGRNLAAGEPEAREISTDSCAVQAWVIRTDEEVQIAREVNCLLNATSIQYQFS